MLTVVQATAAVTSAKELIVPVQALARFSTEAAATNSGSARSVEDKSIAIKTRERE